LLVLLSKLLLLLLLLAAMRLRRQGAVQNEMLLAMSIDQAQPETEEIWRTLSDRLRQFIRSRVPSAGDAEDILQTVFLRIHQNVSNLQQSDRLESWVFQIARNAVADHFRQAIHEPFEADLLAAPVDGVQPDNLNAEVAGCLDVMFERLPAEIQRAVAMYEREGISQKEIASRESISLSGAKSRIQRGRKLLKKMMEDCCRLQLDRYGNVVMWKAAGSRIQDGGKCECNSSCDNATA
jgi:RNA polymerase sigma-70 factor (ECF subfamily)